MRATLHISLLAATLSPSLVHSSPIPFVQNYNSSPRSPAQVLSDSSRPGGVFSGRSPLTHRGSGGFGLGLLNLGSGNGGNGGDASSGSSYAQGGDHHDNQGDHPSGGSGPPAIDLGPIPQSGDQPQPKPNESNGDPKSGPNDPVPSPGIDPNVVDAGNKPADATPPEKNTNPGDPTTSTPKPDPDPGANKGAPDIPIFLGPSNTNPSPGGDNPPSNAPKDAGHPGNEVKHKYTDDTSCDGILGQPLINLLSNNGGDGGDASSGAATSLGYGGGGSSSAYSGAGGDASGGSVYASPALVNILSNNGGDGGNAKSGDSYSKRHGSASHSGPGGNASGGSVKNSCSRRRAVSRAPIDSDMGRDDAVIRSRSGGSVLALQRKSGPPAAYSGKGGDASGGSVGGGHALINFWSGNGGDGGDASSGSAFASGPGAKAYSGTGGNAAGGNVERHTLIDVRAEKKMFYLRFFPRGKYGQAHAATDPVNKNGAEHHDRNAPVNVLFGNAYAHDHGASTHSGPGGNASGGSVNGKRYDRAQKRDDDDGRGSGAEAYTGSGGNASGGSVEGGGGLINLLSGNGGDGGDASSGSAFAYGKDAKAYSGHGGDASGGSVEDEIHEEPGHGYGHRSDGIIDVASGNGGDGGDASSGDAIAVSGG